MYLTPEEKEILDGSHGEAAKLAMETLVKIGDINGAERFIPIKNVHLVLHAYKSAFDAGVETAEKIAEMGGNMYSVLRVHSPAQGRTSCVVGILCGGICKHCLRSKNQQTNCHC